jgi:hypothetical protein
MGLHAQHKISGGKFDFENDTSAIPEKKSRRQQKR